MKPHLNKGLFSNYYLDEQLPGEEEFKIPPSKLESALQEVKEIWDKTHLSTLNEPQLRKHFLDKIFEILGWTIDVEPQTSSGESSKRPDYTLFQSQEDLRIAQKASQDDYFKKALCIGEAKRWGRPLDRKLREEKDLLEVQNPSLQMSQYLWLTAVKWGILTDGKYWRLYERETSKRLDIFYEIDLENLIENGSVKTFKYFYMFFRRDAFPKFVEKVYNGSIDYAEAVGEELKENVYQALKILAQGFLKTPGNDLKEIHLREIHDNSLILLYRLLFILYAEYRGLLPVGKNPFYTKTYSLDNLKKEISERLDRRDSIPTTTHGYWNKLKELFEIINTGNTELEVPSYNGGLFDPNKHEFLERYRVGDSFIVRTIDLLSRSKDIAYIDYGSLEIRHLGSIYEGLLEYILKIADEDIAAIKVKGKNVFIPLEKAKEENKKIKEEEIVRKGEVYLATDKGERKATGSYYTPDYIVKYIVSNTLGPILEDKRKAISERAEFLKERIKDPALGGAQKNAYKAELKNIESGNVYLEEILKTKVLDPAMGSGHFMVEATDFLAVELLKLLSGESTEELSEQMRINETTEPHVINKDEAEDIRWARREVVERCIFGVDLNPLAVELTKLSLWLYTVAKNRPLNFLDHHLRCGNSLIGARVDDLKSLPTLTRKKTKKQKLEEAGQITTFEHVFRQSVFRLLGAFAQIEELPSDTVEQIRGKEKLYQDFRKIVSRFQDVADVWNSVYFGNEVDFVNYQRLQDKLRSSDADWTSISNESWFKNAKVIADEKRFFHWEVEFPEVFFEGHQPKDNPGFDAVIGNPPYYTLTLGKGQQQANEMELVYFDVFYPHASEYKMNTFSLFSERAVNLIKHLGHWSFILPNTILTNYYMKNLRHLLVSDFHLRRFVDLRFRVFEEAEIGGNALMFAESLTSINQASLRTQFMTANTKDEFLSGFNSLTDVSQSIFSEMPYCKFLTDSTIITLLSRIWRNAIKLDQVATIYQGIITGNNKKFLARNRCTPKHAKIIRGDDIERNSLTFNGYYVLYDPDQLWSNADPDMFLVPRKIVSRQTGDHLVAALDLDKFFTLDSTHVIHPKINHFVFLALFNSRLLNFVYQQVVPEVGKTFAQVKAINLKQLPIRCFSFTTSKEDLKMLLRKGKMLYEQCMKNRNDEFVTDFVKRNLHSKPERSDVVHDLLAFLAEQMIEMNKDKKKEIKGFLEWLENQLKIQSDSEGNRRIDILTGRSQIRNYLGNYQKGENHLSFKDFWRILENNKNKIQANLKSRELYENIQTEYEKSLSKLLPLNKRLRKTDRLIDQIVYKLYGLTEEEIKIVESNR